MKTLNELPPEFHQIPDVQAVYGIINGLLTGTKKLVIESKASKQITPGTYSGGSYANGLIDYVHTIKLEDVNAKGK